MAAAKAASKATDFRSKAAAKAKAKVLAQTEKRAAAAVAEDKRQKETKAAGGDGERALDAPAEALPEENGSLVKRELPEGPSALADAADKATEKGKFDGTK